MVEALRWKTLEFLAFKGSPEEILISLPPRSLTVGHSVVAESPETWLD
jgi:hypothetical protein